MNKTEEALRKLLLILKSFPQCSNFSDVPSKVNQNFKDALTEILESLEK